MAKLKPGLCSVTFRKLSVQEIIALVIEAKLECIEWGGDIHVPHGDVQKASEVKQLMQVADLKTAAYGSYYRVGEREAELSFASVLATAKALGAPSIRVWPGTKGSSEASESYFEEVVKDARRIADLAAPENISISFEFHGNTLTDTNEATLSLLNACNHPNLYSFWQPPHFRSQAYRAEGLKAVLAKLTNIHMFYWPEPSIRRPLSEAKEEWLYYLDIAKISPKEHPVMLEFVENDSPEVFLREAKTLLEYLDN